MNRRGFLVSLLAVPLAPLAAKRIYTGIDWGIPLFERMKGIPLLGIPYYETNAAVGTWAGITRSTVPQFRSTVAWMHPSQREAYRELTELVKNIEIKNGNNRI
jgi:hypothetical protein